MTERKIMKSFNNWIQRLREQDSEVPYSGDWAIPQNTAQNPTEDDWEARRKKAREEWEFEKRGEDLSNNLWKWTNQKLRGMGNSPSKARWEALQKAIENLNYHGDINIK